MRVTLQRIDPELRLAGPRGTGSCCGRRSDSSASRGGSTGECTAPTCAGLECEQRWVDSLDDGVRVRVRTYRPRGRVAGSGLPGVLFLHGGGYAMGSPEQFAPVYRMLLRTRDCVIVAPDYRKSLEAPYPAAVNDSYGSLLWLKQNAAALGVREDQLFVMGMSAGGGLTAAVSLMARDRGDVRIAHQFPLYPMLDHRMVTESSRDNDAPLWGSQAQPDRLGSLPGRPRRRRRTQVRVARSRDRLLRSAAHDHLRRRARPVPGRDRGLRGRRCARPASRSSSAAIRAASTASTRSVQARRSAARPTGSYAIASLPPSTTTSRSSRSRAGDLPARSRARSEARSRPTQARRAFVTRSRIAYRARTFSQRVPSWKRIGRSDSTALQSGWRRPERASRWRRRASRRSGSAPIRDRTRVVFRDAGAVDALLAGHHMALAEAYLHERIDVVGSFEDVIQVTDHLVYESPSRLRELLWWLRFLLDRRGLDQRSIAHHYDRPPDFFLAWLDRTRSYTHGFYASAGRRPDARPSTRKLQYAIDALGLEPGMEVFDMGCGWGAFLEYAGARGIRVQGITLSRDQHAFVSERIRSLEAALPRRVRGLSRLPPRRAPSTAPSSWEAWSTCPTTGTWDASWPRICSRTAGMYCDFVTSKQGRLGGAFMTKYIFPGVSNYVDVPGLVRVLLRAGLNVSELGDDTLSCAFTVRDWARNLEREHEALALRHGELPVRAFLLYLWSSYHFLAGNRTQAYHLVASRDPLALPHPRAITSASATAAGTARRSASPTRP